MTRHSIRPSIRPLTTAMNEERANRAGRGREIEKSNGQYGSLGALLLPVSIVSKECRAKCGKNARNSHCRPTSHKTKGIAISFQYEYV